MCAKVIFWTIVGKMGNHRQALQSIVHDLQDVEYAIDFCKEHNYKSLWDELITYSLTNPSEFYSFVQPRYTKKVYFFYNFKIFVISSFKIPQIL